MKGNNEPPKKIYPQINCHGENLECRKIVDLVNDLFEFMDGETDKKDEDCAKEFMNKMQEFYNNIKKIKENRK